jgi:hypothetical protein
MTYKDTPYKLDTDILHDLGQWTLISCMTKLPEMLRRCLLKTDECRPLHCISTLVLGLHILLLSRTSLCQLQLRGSSSFSGTRGFALDFTCLSLVSGLEFLISDLIAAWIWRFEFALYWIGRGIGVSAVWRTISSGCLLLVLLRLFPFSVFGLECFISEWRAGNGF